MRENGFFDRLNRSVLSVAAVSAGIVLLMLLCNFRTDLVADDYRYFFSFADESPIREVLDIVPSMAAHRLSMNGRLTAHALVQLFLLLPLPVFKVVNSLMFLALLLLIYSLSRRGMPHNALLLAAIFGALWLLQPDFGQVFLWLDGSINYLWCAVLCMLFLLPYVNKYLYDRDLGAAGGLGFAVFSFLMGGYSENSTVAVVFMALLLLALSRLSRGYRPGLWAYLSLAAALLGFGWMMSAPAELQNKSARFTYSVLLENLTETGSYYLLFWPLIISFILLYLAAKKAETPKEPRVLALVFLGGSLAGHFVLTLAMYCTGRSTYIGLVLLLTACGILFSELFAGRARRWLSGLCALCLCFTLYRGYVGVSDILHTHYLMGYNEEIIRQCAADGERNVQLPRLYAKTKYPALAGLNYLSTEDVTDWANHYMALYYGVDTVIGY